MSLTVERLPIGDGVWLAHVSDRPEATIFHHPAWAQAVAETYGLTTFVLALRDEDGIAHGIPCAEVRGPTRSRRWVCLPFTDCCPPLSRPGLGAPPVDLLEEACRASGVSSLEIRAELPTGPHAHLGRETVRHVLTLSPDLDVVRAGFHPSQVRRNIKRSEREGVEVERSVEREALVDVFFTLHARTRRRQGTPVQPRRFFERIWEHVVEPGHGYVGIARHGGDPVAAALFLSWNGTTVYKFGASDERLWSLRANHALFWDAIRTSVAEGRTQFDFGRTELDQEGLRSFKAAWGAEELPLRYVVVGRPAAAPSSGRGTALMRPVIQRSPVWVARAIGAVAYRYAA